MLVIVIKGVAYFVLFSALTLLVMHQEGHPTCTDPPQLAKVLLCGEMF